MDKFERESTRAQKNAHKSCSVNTNTSGKCRRREHDKKIHQGSIKKNNYKEMAPKVAYHGAKKIGKQYLSEDEAVDSSSS